jgi:hypothetical protein
MRLLNRIAAVAAFWVLLAPAAWAQYPPPNANNPQTKARTNIAPRAPQGAPAQTQSRTAYRPNQYQYQQVPAGANSAAPRSVLHHYPYYGSNDYSYGFRNPGGVGRYEEYYPPGNSFATTGRDPVTRAGFDQGLPVGSVEEQAMATNTGTARYSAFQQHMDNFSRPMGGWGWGFGLGAF